MYKKREVEALLRELAATYPVVSVTGPRQSGKTTLTRFVLKDKKYVSLETLEQRRYAEEDPQNFLRQSQNGLIIDEAQNCPELFPYIQGIVDDSPEMGQFILIGSRQFNLLSGITQSLAGRVGCLELLPFSLAELDQEMGGLEEAIYKGFYPPLHVRRVRPNLWYQDYIKTYVERDVRALVNIKNLSLFQKFLRLCAARTGQLINFSELSVATGVDVRTVKSWISVLQASYIIFLLRPHHKNFSKKVVKTPKLYFYDSGLLCSLLRLGREELPLSSYKGPIFESMIIGEMVKFDMNYRLGLDIFFWRDSKGVEVDVLFERGQRLTSVEIKSGGTIQPGFFKNLQTYRSYAKREHGRSCLVYGGEEDQRRDFVEVFSWRNVSKMFKHFLNDN